jgi:hypothetical protein
MAVEMGESLWLKNLLESKIVFIVFHNLSETILIFNMVSLLSDAVLECTSFAFLEASVLLFNVELITRIKRKKN